MTMLPCSDRITPAPWRSFFAIAILALLGAGELAGQNLDSLVAAYRKRPTSAGHAQIVRYAQAHPKDSQGALAWYALGQLALEQGALAEAKQSFQAIGKRLPKLDDYVDQGKGSATLGLKDYDAAISSFQRVVQFKPASPLMPDSVIGMAQAHRLSGRAPEAIQLLRTYQERLNSVSAEMEAALSYESFGDQAAAAYHFQKAYYLFPGSWQEPAAADGMARLKAAMGAIYPNPAPEMMLRRGAILMETKDYQRARREFVAMAPLLTGLEREQARVRVGVADYLEKDTREAYQYLKGLSTEYPEADAERLYYLAASARRLDRDSEFEQVVQELSRKYPKSEWTLRGLIDAGNQHVRMNDPAGYVAYYRTCYESFPAEERTANCHWRVAWNAYLSRQSGVGDLLREHVSRFPTYPKAAAALYFLGRLAESAGDPAAAKAYYLRIKQFFANYYYASRARERLRRPELEQATPSPTVNQALDGVAFRAPDGADAFQTTPIAKQRFERARLLAASGYPELGDKELRFGAESEGPRAAYGIELAELAVKRGFVDQGMRYLKRYANGYLTVPLDVAPQRFWELLFPLPYKTQIVSNSRLHGVDPYVMAGLIRQESEFNPEAISRAKAYGLAQVLPSTGRSLSRKLGIRKFSAKMLFRPEVNIKIGTYYFRMLLDEFNGQLEPALASYNAGKSRADDWLTWAKFREPAEFVETIPFTETRTYIQAVLTNAEVYRRLYEERGAVAETPARPTTPHSAENATRSRRSRRASP